ncbi:MAG TPA: hypothetical protein DDW49_09225 [Deltaproteobacteria bacterium]|nr:MAG: hypothetical protein A2048_08695 [Deltaproteobacteria bacterium GWA2_45_12]HBF13542.1 hypothetical protein [Deltaproteobacteria bacterium]
MKTSKHPTKLFLPLLIFALCTVPQWAYAAGPAWESALQTIVDIMTGTTARLLSILAVVFFGILALFGRISWIRALQVALGISIVFGAASIVDMFAGN